MKHVRWLIPIICSMFVAWMIPHTSYAQEVDEEKKTEKKVYIIKKIVDEEGNEIIEEIIHESEDGDDIEIEWNMEGLEEIELDLENLNEQLYRISISEDGDEPIIFEWNGEDEIPDDLAEKMKDYKFHLDDIDLRLEELDFDRNLHNIIIELDEDITPPNKAVLGVVVENAGSNGVMIKEVIPGSGAEDAGLENGDIITSINGEDVRSVSELIARLQPFEPNDKVKVRYLRDGKVDKEKVVLQKPSKHSAYFSGKSGHKDHSCHRVSPECARIIKECERKCTDKIKSDKVRMLKEKAYKIKKIEKEQGVGNGDTEESDIQEFEGNLQVFPNPSNSVLQVRYQGNLTPVSINVTDMEGNILYSEDIEDFDGSYSKEINLEEGYNGTAILTIMQDGQTISEKILLN